MALSDVAEGPPREAAYNETGCCILSPVPLLGPGAAAPNARHDLHKWLRGAAPVGLHTQARPRVSGPDDALSVAAAAASARVPPRPRVYAAGPDSFAPPSDTASESSAPAAPAGIANLIGSEMKKMCRPHSIRHTDRLLATTSLSGRGRRTNKKQEHRHSELARKTLPGPRFGHSSCRDPAAVPHSRVVIRFAVFGDHRPCLPTDCTPLDDRTV